MVMVTKMANEMGPAFLDMCAAGFPEQMNASFKRAEGGALAARAVAQMGASMRRVVAHLPEGQQGCAFEGMSEENSPFWSGWATVQQPTLVVAGTDDAFCLSAIEATACLVPNARLEVLPGANHQPHVEHPVWFSGHL